jgi:hypothetical protein
MRTIAAVFANMHEAIQALHDLERIGVPTGNISILAGNDDGRHDHYLEKAKRATMSNTSAAIGGARLGGGLGLVVTLLTLAVPGVGPMLTWGAMASVLAGGGIGAASFGLISALHNMGIHHEEAPLYEEAVRRGAVMLMASVDDTVDGEAVEIMRRHNGRDIRDEADTWKAAGWTRPDPHPFPVDDEIVGVSAPDGSQIDY